jgi:hypothetical protein
MSARTIRGAEEKKAIVADFLGSADYDLLVILSHDEVEDIAAAEEAVRDLVEPNFNCILCFGAESPIFIVPRDGISLRTKTVLLMDTLPKGWDDKPNVVEFVAYDVDETSAGEATT